MIITDKQKLKCFFGLHNDVPYATFDNVQENIYKCRCCGKYRIFHYGIGLFTPWMKSIQKYDGMYKKY